MSIGIFYGSNGGVTEGVAKRIEKVLGKNTDLIDISKTTAADFDAYSSVILGTSTWGEGDLQDDWDDFFDTFKTVDLSNKTVALFGVGDQENYADTFVNGMGTLYMQAEKNGAVIVGNHVSAEGYDFEESTACIDGNFVGLVIDEENQEILTQQRIEQWVREIKKYFF